MATLYEITGAARELHDLLQNEKIDEQTFRDTLEAIGADEKVEAYCKIIKDYDAESEMLEGEIKRLTARKRTAENNVTRMKNALLDFMTATGQDKAKGGTFTATLARTKSVEITDAALIPAVYLIPQEPKIDKKAIRTTLDLNGTVAGAALRETVGVRIR